jgi:hypothetical protein
MKKGLIIFIGLFFSLIQSWAQGYEKVSLDSKDSTKFFLKVVPKRTPIGLIILLPGSRVNVDWEFKATKIPQIAADSGFVTIFVPYEQWTAFLIDDLINLINKSIEYALSMYKIPKDKCVIGGFSGGGAIALNYTELAFKDSTKTSIRPKGVFGLDAPVDLIELYNVLDIEMKGFVNNGEKVKITDETRYMHEKMNKYLGTPKSNYTNYVEHSAFIFSDRYNDGGQAIYLNKVPVRIYSGIDYNYLQNKVDGSFYFDSSPYFIFFLKSKGNKDATFKSQYDKDYNPDGGEQWRGRHEWYGFDSKECVDWIIKIIKKQ